MKYCANKKVEELGSDDEGSTHVISPTKPPAQRHPSVPSPRSARSSFRNADRGLKPSQVPSSPARLRHPADLVVAPSSPHTLSPLLHPTPSKTTVCRSLDAKIMAAAAALPTPQPTAIYNRYMPHKTSYQNNNNQTHTCPKCGTPVPGEENRIAELEAQVRILTDKATAAGM